MGSREGGLAAAKTLKQKYGDTFYAEIGRRGGSAGSVGKGFDCPTACNCTLVQGTHKLAKCRGKLGGLKSRRTGIKNGEGKSHSKM